MGRCKLFEGWTFKLSIPAPFDDPALSGPKDYGISQYNGTGRVMKATLHAPSIRALLAYAKLVLATEAGAATDGLGVVGHQGNTFKIAEYKSAGKTDCVVFNVNTGKFIVGQFPDDSDTPNPYNLGMGGGSGSAMLFALMPIFDSDTEFHDCFNTFKQQMDAGWPDMKIAEETALTLCDNMYRRIEAASVLHKAGIKVAIPASGNITALSKMALDNGSYTPTGELYGSFTILQVGAQPTASNTVYSHADFVGKFSLSQRKLSAREEAMVPVLPDYYIIPKEVVRVCEHAMLTTPTSQPMRNFLFRGPAGTGKTMGAQAIAAGLHLPYTLITCNTNTEISDIVGQFIPDAGDSAGGAGSDIGELPKISDIIMHPPSVYKELTGIYDEDRTEDDVLEKLIEIAVSKLMVKEEKHGQRIRYVESPLLEAIRHGYVCEVQEPSCIMSPGVLVGLNALMDNCQLITLPTGERVHRHPDAVIVVTTNAGYEGCRPLNQSILSRLELKYEMEAPNLATMVQRIMKITGFTDEQEATKMAKVVRDIDERCRQTMILDGCCGMREFKAWVLSTMITKDPYESALSTIISSASADPDNQADLISTCLEQQYQPS